jgi:pentatricopeptide repeat protein
MWWHFLVYFMLNESFMQYKVKPDRVVFNALITACGQSGAVDRAFDVLAEMGAETQPIDPDNVTIGALIKACANAGQVRLFVLFFFNYKNCLVIHFADISHVCHLPCFSYYPFF